MEDLDIFESLEAVGRNGSCCNNALVENPFANDDQADVDDE